MVGDKNLEKNYAEALEFLKNSKSCEIVVSRRVKKSESNEQVGEF